MVDFQEVLAQCTWRDKPDPEDPEELASRCKRYLKDLEEWQELASRVSELTYCDEEGVETLGGYLMKILGEVPEQGDVDRAGQWHQQVAGDIGPGKAQESSGESVGSLHENQPVRGRRAV